MSEDKIYPDYNGGSIVNLMSSIARARGAATPYLQARLLPARRLRAYRNIVLVVLDGLGYDYLVEKGRGSILVRNMLGSITSVFPSTTATAVTTFATGLAPLQHGVTGWFVYLRELGLVSTILQLKPRTGGADFSVAGVKPGKILGFKPLADRLRGEAYFIGPRQIINTDFTAVSSGGSRRVTFSSLPGLLVAIRSALAGPAGEKYIYAYWSEFDHLAHEKGYHSLKTARHFDELARGIKRLAREIAGTDTALVVTADHGLVDTTAESNLALEDHAQLKDTLSMPLCGEGRIPYCYLKPGREDEFCAYVLGRLGGVCEMLPRQELIKKGVFGKGKANGEFESRVGDYVLLMKDNFSLRDSLPGERKKKMIARHGGLSRAEMLVPLVLIEC